ncbi:hypothetical protein CEXT_490901 [Caerostris extrusa]|uniref:Uncharacterized protein n=1 Tax=Caerostris extrusa TaxID=172846 RepID=A0AAV4XM02_CAEEX|nr:hypothetical protein CEXT_490901 [Caerostris extrusa]
MWECEFNFLSVHKSHRTFVMRQILAQPSQLSRSRSCGFLYARNAVRKPTQYSFKKSRSRVSAAAVWAHFSSSTSRNARTRRQTTGRGRRPLYGAGPQLVQQVS